MKKITAGILTAALVVALGGATVSAVGLGQTERGSAVQDRTQEQLYKNANGICDYRENVSDTADAAYGSDVRGNGWHHSYGSGSGSAHGYGHGHGCR